MNRALQISVLVLGLFGSAAAPLAQAPDNPSLGAAVAVLVQTGQYERARALLSEAIGAQPDAGLHRGQLEGMIALAGGRNEQAVVIFRAILAMRPDFLPARIALADALARAGSYEASLYHYELIALAGDAPARTMAAARINAVRAALPYGFSGYVSLVPSTNANRGSGHETFNVGPYKFTIDPDSRATSGIGLGAGGEAHHDFRLGPDRSVRASVAGHVVKYLESDAFDTLQLSGSLALEQEAGLATLSIGPTVSGHWSGWEYALTRYGVDGSAQVPVGSNNLVALSFSALVQDFAVSDYRDGYRLEANAMLIHQFDAAHRIEMSFGALEETTQMPHLDHIDLSAGVAFASEWPGGLLTEFFGDYEVHDFVGSYPGIDAARQDHRWSAGATLAHRSLEVGGFVPELTYRYTRQYSNVSFFDYDSHDIDFTIRREF